MLVCHYGIGAGVLVKRQMLQYFGLAVLLREHTPSGLAVPYTELTLVARRHKMDDI